MGADVRIVSVFGADEPAPNVTVRAHRLKRAGGRSDLEAGRPVLLPRGCGALVAVPRGPPQPDLGFDREPDLYLDQTPAFDTTEPEPIPDFDGVDPDGGA